jgi:hypothetical protein
LADYTINRSDLIPTETGVAGGDGAICSGEPPGGEEDEAHRPQSTSTTNAIDSMVAKEAQCHEDEIFVEPPGERFTRAERNDLSQ